MIRRVLASLVLVLVLLGAGIYLGGHPSGLPGFVRDPLVGDQDTRVIGEALDQVHNTYYREIPDKDLANASIRGMVASLKDRFSNYFDPQQYAKFQQQQSGEFAGIGVQVTEVADGLRVAEVYDNSPASRAKVEVGDVLFRVGGTSLKGRTSKQSVALIQGRIGTDVRLGVRHKGTVREVTLTRATISVPVVASKDKTVRGKELGVVKLAQFSSGAHAEVAQAVRKELKAGAKGIVFDLRDNPGGLVTEAQLVASAFLPDGKIVTTKGRAVPSRTLSATGDPVAPKTPMVVLVNRNSASAAEIVAGALQDRKRATLVGTRTFGKGVFQEVIDLSNGGALDITAGQYFLPSGRNLGGKGTSTGSGLTPDVAATDDPKTPKVDEALDRALDVLAARS
ncbi:MAG TPA: S41 family peptidase [Baekduia sp.]|uniref:S41 family peptidase n=1 Tax=Baekduia sp. TaxID=2600305 RepID=UPI002C463FF5|nr:S41 family peptidase [Baekduia sp.]HMJ33715.1 S41 family peptidase [Baekduia sp.]